MNAKTGLFCTCFLFFGIFNNSNAYEEQLKVQQIPGGIVYSNGKDAIFLKFETNERFNLTSDLSEIVVEPPFAVSENGKQLVWSQNAKFYVKELPIGTWHSIQTEIKIAKGDVNSYKGVSIGKKDIIWQRPIKNFSLSPNGEIFAFESPHTTPGWILFDQGNPRSFAKMMASGAYANFSTSDPTKDDIRFNVLPLYIKRNDSFNGIFYLSTIQNVHFPPSDDIFVPIFGNVIDRPGVPLFKATVQDLEFNPAPGTILRSLGHGLLGVLSSGGELKSNTRVYNSITVKKNAFFLTFQKLQSWESGQGNVAFIYQIGNQWGPIEIQNFYTKKPRIHDYYNHADGMVLTKNEIPKESLGKARLLEIQTTFPTAEGLAWKPDGSLSVLSQGNVYLINCQQIQGAFNRSSMAMAQDQYRKGEDHVIFSSANNILQPKLELIAKGITGTCFNWVSNSSFIFLGIDNNVYLWNQENVEKIADSVGEFSYCSLSPFENINDPSIFIDNRIRPKNVAKTENPLAIIGKTNKVKETTVFSVGNITTAWSPHTKESVHIYIKPFSERNSPLQFALIEDENNLDNIKDPSQYEYLSSQKRGETVADDKLSYLKQIKKIGKGKPVTGSLLVHQETKTSSNNVRIALDRIIILKLGNAYAAVKPISVEMKENPWQMTYEWKYWPEVIPPVISVKKVEKKELWEIAAIPISKEFYIDDNKFSWKTISPTPKEKNPTREPKPQFRLCITINGADKVGYVGIASDWINTSVLDPSKYNFKRINEKGMVVENFIFGFLQDFILIIKIGDKYIAIKPVEEKKEWVQYKWKYWPEVKTQELATAQN